jgi:hypothetical protein
MLSLLFRLWLESTISQQIEFSKSDKRKGASRESRNENTKHENVGTSERKYQFILCHAILQVFRTGEHLQHCPS